MPNLDLDPITRKEQFLSRAAGGVGLDLEPVTREEHFLKAIADSGGGGGGDVTPASIVTATGQMTAEQKSQTRANIGATDASTSIPDNVKQALLACFADVAWADDQGQAHYDALEAALYPLDHITAVYTQSGTVYDTDSLDSLKTDLVVTAFYQSGGSETVTNYTLSGTLTVGTSTITVSYGGKTATFDVTVVYARDVTPLLSSFTSGGYVNLTYSSADNSLRIKTNTASAYQSADTPFSTREGYRYVAEYDMQYISGIHSTGVRNSGNGFDARSSNYTENAHIEFAFNHNSTVVKYSFMCTWATSEHGECVISNFRITEYKADEG